MMITCQNVSHNHPSCRRRWMHYVHLDVTSAFETSLLSTCYNIAIKGHITFLQVLQVVSNNTNNYFKATSAWLITASQWTMSGQNEYLSRQNFGLAVILTGQVCRFQIINTTGHHSKIINQPCNMYSMQHTTNQLPSSSNWLPFKATCTQQLASSGKRSIVVINDLSQKGKKSNS